MILECNDKKCPVHGSVKTRGIVLTGKVISAKAPKSATVQVNSTVFVTKYERYKKKRSKIHAYNPTCMNAKENDTVTIAETRKLSKTKAFAIIKIEKHGKEKEAKKKGAKK